MPVRHLLVAALALFALAAPAAHAGPFATVWGVSPGVDAPGVNAACTPTAAHPVPVVLVHGTWMDRTTTMEALGQRLALEGWCVYALDYGQRATRPVAESAAQLGAFVDDVLARTGAARVSIVGHSQGGMMPRYWLKFGSGAGKVDDLIGLAPSTRGTESGLAGYAAQYGDSPAAADQAAGSPFMVKLNGDGDETPSDADYTVVSTSHDEVVTPVASQALHGPAERVTNVVLQDRCPLDPVEHVGMPYDPVAYQWVVNALSRPGPADPAFAPLCA
jgi:triacylglycerol lipase